MATAAKVKPPRSNSSMSGASSSSRHLHSRIEAPVNGFVPIHREAGQFTRGAVVYLRLHNFLTFDDVELHPGPHLNVIVGPNGTGKSSLVCALCLGLGGSPKLLGRAKDIKDFVKHNTDEGYVEIHLYEPKAKGRNPAIKRVLSATTNSSTYYLNGKIAKQTEVRELVEKMNIQLDNHCQFLPQDMVVEFARMNMHQLLEETEKAIGPKDMYESHEKLKGMKTKSADLGKTLREKRRELEDEQRKNQLLERDVERFKNRQKYMSRIGHLKKKKLWVEYEAAREEWSRKKDARKKTSLKLKELQKKNQPLREKRQKEEQKIAVLKERAQSWNQKVRGIDNRIKSFRDKLGNLEEELEEPTQELERKRKEEANRKGRIKNLKKEIESFENSLKDLEPMDSLRKKIQEKNNHMRLIAQKMDEIHTKQMDIKNESEQYRDAVRQSEDELRRMESIRNQRLDMLQRRDRDTFSAIQWLRENQQLFRQPILEPVAVLVNIKDRRYEAQVEAFLGGRDFHSFVAQNEEDRETFLKEIRDKKQWKVNVVRVPNCSLSEYRPAYSFQDLRRYGFQAMLIDLIEAPEPMLCYFCQYHFLHQVPIAESLSPDQIERIKHDLPKLRLFFTMNTRYVVKQSAYRNAASTRSSELMPARFLVASVDTQRKSELQRQIQESQENLAIYDQQYKEYEDQDQVLRRNDNTLRQEKNELVKVMGSWKSIRSNINSRKTKLDSILSQSPLDLEAAEKQCDEAVKEIQCKRVDCFRELTSLLKSAADATRESVEASLTVRSADMSVTYLQQEYEKAKSEQERAEQDLKGHEFEERLSKERANALLNRARKECKVQNPSDNPELMEMFNDFPNELDRLDDMIHDLQAQAEMCVGTDENTVEDYERRERDIQRLGREIEKIEDDIETRHEKMAELKSKWLDPLKDLLIGINERFRKYFSEHTQMKCAGEVSLEENEDFSKYGILIRVKFRDNEELQALNAQRQSGGERSVSTMLYLLALQATASCPFRVVDEINQGMDPVNERHVFNLIVKSASEGAQYFLLTPKLLQNLEYSEAVQVHIVNNGQEMMSFTDWDMRKFLA